MPAPGATANILPYFKAAAAQQREKAPRAQQDAGHATIALRDSFGPPGITRAGSEEEEMMRMGASASSEPLARTAQLAV